MGLASLLKRKLGKDSQDGSHKKSKASIPISRATAIEIANLKKKSTRTARRKLKKFGALADQPLPDDLHLDIAAERSDADEDAAEDLNGGDGTGGLASSGDGGGGGGGGNSRGSSSAYEALLSSLAATNEDVAGAVELRRRELAGDSDLESSEEEEEEEDEDEDEDETSDMEREAINWAEGAHRKKRDKEEEAKYTEKIEEESEEEQEDEEEEDEESEEEAAAVLQLHLSNGADVNGTTTTNAASSSFLLEDHFDAHLEHQLSEDALAKLATASSTPFIDVLHQEEVKEGHEEKGKKTSKKSKLSSSSSSLSLSTSLNAWLPEAKLQASEGASLPSSAPQQLKDYGVRERLIAQWREVHSVEGNRLETTPAPPNTSNGNTPPTNAGRSDFVSHKQRALFSLLSSYNDLLYPCRGYPTSPLMDAPDPELDAVLLHVINHVARSSDRIKKNNEKLSADKERKKKFKNNNSRDNTIDDAGDLPRDQGFARPKVLFLLPMRSTAMRVVSRLLKLAIKETRVDSIQNKERFLEEFGTGEEEIELPGAANGDESGLNAREKAAIARKPVEYRGLFTGNLDDHFRLGMKLTRGAVRLYTDFYQSDVLIASPLALATKLSEAEKDQGSAGAADFLSSIEIVVLERADVLQMQNWTHVTTVLDALNKMPSQQRDVDIMRVREWMLSGQAKHYRQTIILSSFASAEMNSLIVRKCCNHSGRIRVHQVNQPGVLRHIVPQVRQIYERLSIPVGAGPAGDADARFDNFKSVIWPRIRETARGGGQLIYIPSYFDFVRVRNYLRAESASFLGLCEYTERADMARARSYFADGRRRVLVYTERAQFYNRHRIRGVKDILFYQLPEHPQFYSELVNFLEEENTPGVGLATATVMYSKYDVLRLERVVGSERAKTMVKKKNGTFLFC